MTRAATLIPALLVAAPLALSCGADNPPAPSTIAASELEASPSEASPSEASPSETSPSENGAVAPDGVPKITSDAAVHEFGAIKPKDSIDHVFKIRNAGTANLKIERVQRT